MGKKLRFGIIGCGWIGQLKHIPNYSKHPDTEITALCDKDTEKAAAVAKKFGLDVKIYSDYKDMLLDKIIDVVVVATPNCLHCEMTVAALEAGKHVLCEKPMATTAEEAQKMINAAKKAGKKLTVGHQWRFRPECLYIKNMCEKGLLGDIYFAKAHGIRRRGVPTWGEYLDITKNGGGTFYDGAGHPLDLTLWLMDNYEPLSVKANMYKHLYDKPEGNPWGKWDPSKVTVDDFSGFALITMKNGATIYVEAAFALNVSEGNDMKTTLCGTKCGVDMFGENGLTVNLINEDKMAKMYPDVKSVPFPGIEPLPDPMEYEGRLWVDCIKNDTEPAVKPEQTLVVVQLLEGMYKSARTGKEVFF